VGTADRGGSDVAGDGAGAGRLVLRIGNEWVADRPPPPPVAANTATAASRTAAMPPPTTSQTFTAFMEAMLLRTD